MIGRDTGISRRIFTFPAVCPCDCVNLSTLVASLTDLATDICEFKSKVFSTNAKNACAIIRSVSNLNLFFDEIRDLIGSGLNLPVWASICFSELRVNLQRIRFLLEDCTREGARLLMAMKSEQVAIQFGVFARDLAASLDNLPLRLLDLPIEVKELVRFVKIQAERARFGIDPADKSVIEDVLFVLNQFENCVAVDNDIVERVLDSIGVRTWSDCCKEIRLLGSEIGFEHSNDGERRRKFSLLSGLVSFMIYSRCVLFGSTDDEIPQIGDKLSNQLLKTVNIDDFRCPISLEFMKDPVTAETGHTYDRSSILKWFRAGNRTCPSTGKRLETTELTPNLVLKGLIQSYCIENGISCAESIRKNHEINRIAHPALKIVAGFLVDKLARGDDVEKSKAVYEIRVLSKSSFFCSCLMEANVIPNLVAMLLCDDCLCQENSIAGLSNLSKHSICRSVIVNNGGLELIVHVLKNGLKVEAKQHASSTLFYLASVDEYRKQIGGKTEAIPALLQLIKEGNNRAKKNGLVAIFGLLMYPGNHWRVIKAGAVQLLVNILTSSESEEIVTDCLAVLASLAEKLEGTKAIIGTGALSKITGLLGSASSRAVKEQCVCLLLALCVNGGNDVSGQLAKSPLLMVSLYSVMSEGTARACKKASSLIKILHDFNERSSSGSKSRVLPRERPVHVW